METADFDAYLRSNSYLKVSDTAKWIKSMRQESFKRL